MPPLADVVDEVNDVQRRHGFISESFAAMRSAGMLSPATVTTALGARPTARETCAVATLPLGTSGTYTVGTGTLLIGAASPSSTSGIARNSRTSSMVRSNESSISSTCSAVRW